MRQKILPALAILFASISSHEHIHRAGVIDTPTNCGRWNSSILPLRECGRQVCSICNISAKGLWAMRPLEAAYRAKGPESDHHDQAFTARYLSSRANRVFSLVGDRQV